MAQTQQRARIFYGWWIVLAGVLCTFVGSGIGFYEVGVFIDPLTHTHGWSRNEVSAAITLLFAATGVLGVLIGRDLDRHGPRRVLLLGTVAMSSSLFLIGHLQHVWQLYAVYLWMAVGYCSLSSIPVTWMISRWFVRRRAFALSIALAGTSLGGIVLVPISQAVIHHAGLTAAATLLAVLVLVIALPITLGVVRTDPRDRGLLPDGDTPRDAARTPVRSLDYPWTIAEALRTLPFWAITLAFAIALVGQTAYLIHQIPYLEGPLGAEPAAFAVSMTAIASVIGRFCVGVVERRFTLRQLSIGCFLLQSGALLILALVQHPVSLFVMTFLFGLTIGNVYMLQALVTAECFGVTTYGTVYGLVSVLTLFGSAAGPSIASAAVAFAGSYARCFAIMAGCGLLATWLIHYARPALPPRRQREERPETLPESQPAP